jgi:regulator of protease activity HflC (stomatin/prohibitin superfamily)
VILLDQESKAPSSSYQHNTTTTTIMSTLDKAEAPLEEIMNRGLTSEDPVEEEENKELLVPDPRINTTFPGCVDAPLISRFLTCVFSPVIYTIGGCGCFEIPERTHAAVLYYGKYTGTVQEPGIHFLLPCGLALRTISTATRNMDMKDLKVVDLRGNPVIVSAVVAFEATSARRARVDVENPWPRASWNPGVTSGTYLQLQAQAVLKQVVSQFPYEAPLGQPSLQTEGTHITEMLIKSLQSRVKVTGAKIISFDLVDLSYAPEIAAHMLVRQQAAALVDARALIVDAAVDMTHSAIEKLEAKGRSIDDATKNNIVTNLLTVICSNEAVKPVVNTNGTTKETIVVQPPHTYE